MIRSFFQKLGEWIVKRSVWLIVGVGVVTVGLCIFMVNLQFDNDFTRWFSRTSPIGKLPYYVNERFGSYNPILVGVHFKGEVFDRENLEMLNRFTEAAKQIPGVDSAMSIASVDAVESDVGGIVVKPLVEFPLPKSESGMREVRSKMIRNAQYTERMVSKDDHSTMVVVKPVFGRRADKTAILVKQKAKEIFGNRAELHFAGNPNIMNSISEIVTDDFKFLVPLVILLVALVLYFSFHTLRGVVLPLGTVLIATGMTMGLMGLAGTSLNVLSSAIPVILIAVGSAYGIHILNAYYEETALGLAPKDAVKAVVKEQGMPVLMAALTTMVGFASNITADALVIQTFGIYLAIGVFFALLVALLMIPSLLIWMPVQKPKHYEVENEDDRVHPFASAVAGWVSNNRVLVIGLFVAAGLVVGFFAVRVSSRVDMLAYFKPDSEPQVASHFIRDNFGGYNPFNVYLKGDIQNPDVLKLSMILSEKVGAYSNLSAPEGINDVIVELSEAAGGLRTIPETKEEVQNLWFFIEGKKQMESMVTPEKDEALLTVLLPSIDNVFVDGLFTPLQTNISLYRGGICVQENYPDHPVLVDLVSTSIASRYRRHNLSITSNELAAGIAALQNAMKANPAKPVGPILQKYLAGDESEIAFNAGQAQKLAGLIADKKLSSQKDILSIVNAETAGMPDVTEDDRSALARSLSMLVAESGRNERIGLLLTTAKKSFPQAASVSDQDWNYCLSPMLWETIPVPRGTAGKVVRETPLPDIQLTGVAYQIEQMRQSLFVNQMSSIALALIAVVILNSITFGSILEGVISLVAIVFTVLVNFGIMGMFGISLDFITAIIAGVTIGTGIDYTIHFISRYTNEIEKTNGDTRRAYELTLSTTGKAIIFNAVAVGLGFAVLLLSNVIPLRTAGMMLAITMVVSSLSAMTLLPAVLMSFKGIQAEILKRRELRAAASEEK